MMAFRRPLYTTLSWLRKNKPSGVMLGWMTFFIVSYIVIVKLDNAGRDTKDDAYRPTMPGNARTQSHPLKFKPGRVRTGRIEIPKEILEEFEQDNAIADRNAGKLYGGTKSHDVESDEPVIDLVGVSNNEMMLFHEMEGNQDEIDENWKNYLDKDKSVVKTNIKSDKHLRFQGVHTNTGEVSQMKRILPSLPKHVHVFDALAEGKQFRDAVADKKCVLLKTLHGDSPICIHDPDDDELISSHLSEHGAWEPNYLYITGNILKLEPELLFIDLGCNLGVYTILAAKLGTAVVAVDPSKQNLRLLTKSLSLGNIRDKVTLIRNAISDTHEQVSLVQIIGNIGGTFVETAEEDTKDEVIESITLDDLTELFKHKAVFIKMDIETYELKALKGATQFFDNVDVRYILMEWIAHRGSDTANEIIDFLTKRDLYPHVNNHHNTKLEVEHSHSWPDNVLWIKY